MRIVFHHRIASRDGQAVHMDEMRAALTRLGHHVILVGPARMARLKFGGEAGVIAVLKKKLPRALYEALEFGYNIVALPRLLHAVLKHRPDAIYERYNLFAMAGPLLRRFYDIPLLLEVNAPLVEERAEADGLAYRRLAARCERAAWRRADFVLPVSNVLAEHLRRAGVPEDRIRIIPNGIDLDKFRDLPERNEAKRRLGLDGKLVLGFTGFVRAWNSLERVVDLIGTAALPQEAHLLLVGDGPARPALESRAKQRGVGDRLTVTGIVPRQAVGAHIAAFDIALQPGVTPYASPLKLFEYMAAGLAIIAPDQANIREILTDGVDAILVDPRDPQAFGKATAQLCRNDALRMRIGAAARQTIIQRDLTWVKNARIVCDLIDAGRSSAPKSTPLRKAG